MPRAKVKHMHNMNEIRHHIRAVEQTRKITNAMHLISSARIKKIMPQVEYNRRYLTHVQEAMRHVLAASESFDHIYLRERGAKHTTFVVMAGDKGMVGAYNSDILKFALPYIQQAPQHRLITMGIMAARFFEKQGLTPDMEIIGASQDPSLIYARHLTQDIFRLYDEHKTDRVYIIYMSFVNSVKWEPRIVQLLPVTTDHLEGVKKDVGMIYHPSPEEVFHLLVPQYSIGILNGALMQAYASEHCARMNAMESATRNADEILKKLRASYNIARQSAITQEITEITGAAMAQSSLEAAYGIK